MKKILFPTEFSDHSPMVFQYAAELAYFFKASLVVMHAFGKPEVRVTSKEALEQKASTTADKMVDFVEKNLPENYKEKVDVNYIAKVGFPADAVLQVAFEEEVDLIVMGMTGKTNALETIFGSTALAVLAKADCPVLAVPATAKFEGFDNFVFTSSFEFRDLEGINYLKKWSKTFEAPVHCLHVIEHKQRELSARKNLHTLKQTYKRHKNLFFDVAEGEFQKTVETFTKRKKADIVAMVSHKRSFVARLLESSAVKGVARQTNVPLLVVKDNAFELKNDAGEWLNFANSIA